MFESDLNGPKANIAELLVKEGLASLKQGSEECLLCCNVTCHVHLPVFCNSVAFGRYVSPQWIFCFHRSMADKAISSAHESVVWDSPLDLGLTARDVDSTKRKDTLEDKEQLTMFELKLPDRRKELHVRVSHVNSPSSFYVQLTQDDSQLSRSADRTQHFSTPSIQQNQWIEEFLWRNILY